MISYCSYNKFKSSLESYLLQHNINTFVTHNYCKNLPEMEVSFYEQVQFLGNNLLSELKRNEGISNDTCGSLNMSGSHGGLRRGSSTPPSSQYGLFEEKKIYGVYNGNFTIRFF